MKIGSKIAITIAFSLVLVVIQGFSVRYFAERMEMTGTRVEKAFEFVQNLNEAYSSLKDAETGQRGFLLTGKDEYQEPFTNAVDDYLKDLDLLIEDAQNNQEKMQQIMQIRRLAKERIAALQTIIEVRRQGGLDAALPLISSDQGKRIMDTIRVLVHEISTREMGSLEEARKEDAAASQVFYRALLTSSLLLIAALVLIGVVLGRSISRPLLTAATIADRISKGDLGLAVPVTHRSDEVGQLLRSFHRMTDRLKDIAEAADLLAAGAPDIHIVPTSVGDRLGGALCTMVENQRIAMEDLRRNREELSRLLEAIPAYVWICNDLTCRNITGNLAANELLGVASGTNVSQSATHYIRQLKPDGSEYLPEELPMQKAMALGKPVRNAEIDFRIEGRQVLAFGNVVPLSDATGAVRGCIAAFVDVTVLKRTEKALRESEEKYRNLFAAMNEGFALNEAIDDETGSMRDVRYLEVNRAFKDQTGLADIEVVGKTMLELFPETESVWFEQFGRVFRTGEPVRFDAWFGPLGKWLAVNAYRTAPGKFAAVFRDITQQKQDEETIRRKNVILEGITRIFHAALTTDTKNSLGEACLAVAKELTRSRLGFIGEIGSDGMLHDIAMSLDGELCGIIDREGGPPGAFHLHGLYGRMILDGTAFFTNDLDSHPDSIELPEGHLPLTNFLGVPLRHKSKIVGLVAVGNCPDGYTIEEQQALEALAPAITEAIERKRAENARRESEERFRALVEATSDVVYQMSPDWTEMRHLVGRDFIADTQEPRSSWLEKYIHPDDQPHVLAIINEAIRTKSVFELEHRVLRVDGSLGWTFSRAIPSFDATGEITDWFGMASDITIRKQAEEQLARDLDAMTRLQQLGALAVQQEDLELVLMKIVETAIAISGADFGNIQLLDPASGELRIAAQRGFKPWWLDFWNSVAKGHGVCGTALERGERVIIENVEQSPIFVGTPGLDIQLQAGVRAVQSTPLFSRSGKPVGMFSTHYRTPGRPDDRTLRLLDLLARQAADIIEHVQIEAALRESQLQFLHAEKLSAIGKLSASIAHEFNSPLQAVMTVMKGLRLGTGLNEGDRKLLEMAISESERMKNLIQSLKDFYRPSSDRKTPLDVNASIDSLLLLYKSDFNRKKISTELHYAERLPHIMAVHDQITQVFLNLLNNAVDACLDHSCVITIRTWREGGRVAVAIGDNGVGIDLDKMDRIFQPFYTTKPAIKGTGLGLSVCHGIVQHHRGEIRVESTPGEGSTFTVVLPIAEE